LAVSVFVAIPIANAIVVVVPVVAFTAPQLYLILLSKIAARFSPQGQACKSLPDSAENSPGPIT